MAATVIDLLTDKKLLKAAKEEWVKQMQDRIYVSPLPPHAEPPLDQLKKQSH
jgi:hypothetical protein